MKTKNLLLQMRNIHVSYNNIKALNGVDFNVYNGEIHAIAGEHRAGKSSLVKILSGAVKKDSGDIFYKGKKINFFSPKAATKNGIGIIYQTSNIIPISSAIENIIIGQPRYSRFFLSNKKAMFRDIQKIFIRLNLNINLKTPVYKLARAQQNMIELTRVLLMNPDLLIFDELSNKLTPEEMKAVYQIIFELKKQNKSIIYISHDMDEILKLADRVTILKDGYRRGTENVNELNKFRLFQLTYSYVLDQKELTENVKRFFLIKSYIENIIQNLPVGVIILDEEKNVQILNFSGINILGLKQNETNNLNIEDLLKIINIPIKEDVLDIINKNDEYEWKEIPLGEKKLLNISIFPFRDEKHVLLGTTILIRDVFLDHSLQDYLIQSEKLASVAEVSVGVAHEINNPLYIIKNYVDLIKRQKIGEKGEARLDKIEKELNRIVEIVNTLLSFSRIKNFNENKVDLCSIVNEVLLLLDFSIVKKHIFLEKFYDSDVFFIKGDENRLKQVFINLINNSIEAVLEGGKIKIQINNDKKNNKIIVSIADDGYGIPKDIYENIFNPFFSTKINKKNTGLGLSISKHIITEHEGEIDFTSTPGKQTCFIIKLPY